MAREKRGGARHARKGSRAHAVRLEGIKNQRRLVIIACEGEKTEPAYFRAIFELLKQEWKLAPHSCVIAGHTHTDPLGVLEDLRAHETSLGFTYKDYDHRWIVIDRDEERSHGSGHTLENFNSALQRAAGKRVDVQVAWSNPCFEIWYLLHFQYRNTPVERDQLYRTLGSVLKVAYEKSAGDMYGLLKDQTNTAIRNAKKLLAESQAKGLSPADSNPGTTVHQLVALLMDLQEQ